MILKGVSRFSSPQADIAHGSKKKHPSPSVISNDVVQGHIRLFLPVKTISEANCFECWQKKHVRHRIQKYAVQKNLRHLIHLTPLPCTITVTRYAPGSLDAHDNLRLALKYIVDAICDLLVPGLKPGRADNDLRITIGYDQIKDKKYFICIDIVSS